MTLIPPEQSYLSLKAEKGKLIHLKIGYQLSKDFSSSKKVKYIDLLVTFKAKIIILN